MARRLTAARAMVRPERREAYLAAVRELAAAHRAGDGRFWLFERTEVPGEFLEFAEHGDASPATAVPAALATRLADLASYETTRHAEWREVPLDGTTGA